MSNILITRPNHDITTNYLYYWAGQVIDEARERASFNVTDLKGKRVKKDIFTGIVKKINPTFIFLNGHGNSKCITGYDDEVIIESTANENLLTKRITYALSCSSASVLGRESVKKGAKSYIGYDDEFIFMFDESKISKPLNDKTAKQFIKPSNQIASSLIKGNTVGDAYKKSQKLFKQTITTLLSSESPQDDIGQLPYLLWDMKHQVCLGDLKAKLDQ